MRHRNGRASGGLSSFRRVLSRPLWQDEKAEDEERADDRCRERPAERQSALIDRFVEKIADRGAEWQRQDERRPEQKDARDIRQIINGEQHQKRRGKDERAAFVAKTRISDPVAERR